MLITRIRRGLFCGLTCAAVSSLGCRDSVKALGPTPAQALANVDDLTASLSARFGPLMVEQRLGAARPKLVRSALAPSRIFNDTVLWTARQSDSSRTLEIEGRPGGTAYVLRMRAGAPAPRRRGESRAVMWLRRVGASDYEWATHHELAVGSVRGSELGNALTELLLAAEQNGAGGVRAGYRAGFPRATAALGRLFSLDTLTVVPAAAGGALVTFAARMNADGIAGTYPSYTRYLHKYLTPVRYSLVLTDDAGVRWAEASGRDNVHKLRVRVHDGSLAPLDGDSRSVPASLHVSMDVSMKAMLFRVGMRGLDGDVTLIRAEHEKGFAARFRREPAWSFPPLVERMIRTPLRRPFEGQGALLTMSVRDSTGLPTLATRDIRLAVRESAIMRWIGGLGNSAMSDFRDGAEHEAERFYREVFAALRADVLDPVTAADTR